MRERMEWDEEEEGQICFEGGNHRLDSSARSVNVVDNKLIRSN